MAWLYDRAKILPQLTERVEETRCYFVLNLEQMHLYYIGVP